MANLTWVNFIHIYQPPWQSEAIVRRVSEESYRFLISMLKRYPSFKMTLNIAGTLIEQLDIYGYQELLKDIKSMIARGQIELTGSSHYHAFLPELPTSEIERQISLQEAALKKYFGVTRPGGFFLPEMAYHPAIGEIIRRRGYRWLILDPMSSHSMPDPSRKYLDRRTGLTVLFRNREFSKSYPPESMMKFLSRTQPSTIITATDGELYGHLHKDWQEHLKQLLESPALKVQTVSEYLKELKESEPIRLRAASWETRSSQVKSNNPFNIWYNRVNPIHKKLWQLAHYAIRNVAEHPHDPNFSWARTHLDRGLASCSWWWASEIKTSPFAPIAWNPSETERGALELIKSIRSLKSLAAAKKIHAETLYTDLLRELWTKHWRTYGSRN